MYCFHQTTTTTPFFLLFNHLSSASLTFTKERSVCLPKRKNCRFDRSLSLKCNSLSKRTTKDYGEVPQHKIVEDVIERLDAKEPLTTKTSPSSKEEYVETVRNMLKSMNDGEISISAYDTAWVALVKDRNDQPQFPSSLEWIANNQLTDGSWGDHILFSAHDRVINTLACVIALKSWNVYPEKREKGILFLKENISKLSNEKDEHMPIGFEVAFPALVDIATNHGIEIAKDSPVLEEINSKRALKLKRIPKEIMHTMPTSLLHSLEGMTGLDWGQLIKLQSQDGSFLFSPSSTAYALMQTKDVKCLDYLTKVVKRFHGGVPNVYPVDMFEHIWVVDRLLRLGISRYFQSEIQDCLSYVYRHWSERGICWARNSEVQDIDDTAMGFRLLRLHGYEVSADVLRNFEKDGKFFCFVGQSTQAVTGMYNLLRASQLQFPNEKILEEAKHFSSNFLKEKQATNQLLDKWIIAEDLPGEVGYALDIPWYANLPRLETRFYIEHYGGENDVWIGKTLYRMPYVSNNIYLELAKSDYNDCQASHRLEWDTILRWYAEYNLQEFGVSQRSLLESYFLAAASLFEPEKSKERLAWAKIAALVDVIASYFSQLEASLEERKDFVSAFKSSCMNQGYLQKDRSVLHNKKGQQLFGPLLSTLNQLSLDVLVTHGRDVRSQLYGAVEKWLSAWEADGDKHQGEAELFVHIIELCAGRHISDAENKSEHPLTMQISKITNRVCLNLGHIRSNTTKVQAERDNGTSKSSDEFSEIDQDMQKLVELVLSNRFTGVDHCTKQTFLAVVRTFYYAAYCSPTEIEHHIAKVLFQKVE